MKHEYLEGNTQIHYPNTIIFTGGGNSYISITNPKSGAECTLLATIGDMDVQIKREAVNGRDIIFPLSDILAALWEHARGNAYPMSVLIDERKFNLNIRIVYNKNITKSYDFILVNGSPDRDVTQHRGSDRRRGVFWGNSDENIELFALTIGGETISRIEASWLPSVNIRKDCYIGNPFVRMPTIDIEAPREGNAEVLLFGPDDPNAENLVLNSNFVDGNKDWSDWGQPITREVVKLDGKKWAHIKTPATPWQGYQQQRLNVTKPNTRYTLSFTARTAIPGQTVGIGIHWLDLTDQTPPVTMTISQSWQYWQPGTTPRRIVFKTTSPDHCKGFNLMIGNGGGGDASTAIATEVWITDIKLEEGDNDNPVWSPTYPLLHKLPLYIDMCPLSERDMELNWFDELGAFCNWRFTEEYNETAVTTDATLTRMAVSNYSLYQTRTRMTRKQTTYTLHSRKVPRDVVPFIKSILSAPLVWRWNTNRMIDDTMIVEDYKEKDYGRGYVDVVIKVTDTPQSYE